MSILSVSVSVSRALHSFPHDVFRSHGPSLPPRAEVEHPGGHTGIPAEDRLELDPLDAAGVAELGSYREHARSEEHTSELQSLTNLVCRLLLEKKKKTRSLS